MPDNLFQSTPNPQPVWIRKLRQAGRKFINWYRTLMYSLMELAILFAATVVIFGAVVTFLKALWYCYLQTPVGRKFISGTTVLKNQTLAELLNKDLLVFSVEIAGATLIACLLTSAVFQMLAMHRFFYEGRGVTNRLIWLFVFSAASAYNLASTSDFDFSIALALCILPSLCMFTTCIKISANLLPELTPVGILELTRRFMNFVASPE